MPKPVSTPVSFSRDSNGVLQCESVRLSDVAAQFGTPLYVYSRAAIEQQWRALDDAFGGRKHLICYAVKASSNIALLSILAKLGSGFDIVSGGELERVLAAGGSTERVVFSGVGKRRDEIEFALEQGIACFNVESTDELKQLEALARKTGKQAPFALRVNPDISAPTHTHTATGHGDSKFGIPEDEVLSAATGTRDSDALKFLGLSVHVGSQITQLDPMASGARCITALASRLAAEGVAVTTLNCGGGLGVAYDEGANVPEPAAYVGELLSALGDTGGDTDCQILIEPGRSIVATAGVLLSETLYIKNLGKNAGSRRLAVVDAGMNDFMRTALYDAWHRVETVVAKNEKPATYDVVGPVCESADYFARDAQLVLAQGDIVAIRDTGAYGASMASTYNSRPRPAEVLIDGGRAHLIRERETANNLFAAEKLP